MTKINFILSLHERLSDLPQKDAEDQLRFYSEIIEDRMEDGISEEKAISDMGSPDEIASQIRAEISSNKPVGENTVSARKLKAREIVLLAVSSPIWLSLLISAIAVALSVYVSAWAVVISLWAIFGSVIGCACYGLITGAALTFCNDALVGVGMIGAGILCTGLAVFLFYGSRAATDGMLLLTRKIFVWVKNAFTKRRRFDV